MRDKLQGTEKTPALTERRACPRLRVTSLMYIDIGNLNGGIVTSFSESGLALTAATALGNVALGDGHVQLRIQFPGIPEAIEASGQIVWTSSSGKEAGVRFVELEEKTREQIRGWISAQAYTEAVRPEPPKLPEMRVPNTRRAKRRPSRFSFSDVASSRVDAESQTGVEDFPGGEPGNVSPLQTGDVGFCDGAEAVASAFESLAFTEDRAGKIRSRAKEQTTQPTSDSNLQRQPALPERRQHSRRPILRFSYAVLGEDNGGLVFNLGEGGLALTAAAPLQEHHFKKIRLRFPDSEDWIEASGRLSWKNDSGKEVGIGFADLPEDARLRIREWVAQEEPRGDLRFEEGEAQTRNNPVHELPSFVEPDAPRGEFLETPASFEEQSFESQAFEEHRFVNGARASASSPALFKTGIKGILERAPVRKVAARIKPPRLPDFSVKPQTWLPRKALGIAAGVALAVGGWMLFQRTPLNEISGIIAQNLPKAQPSLEPKQVSETAKTDVGASGATAGLPVQLREDANKNVTAQTSFSTTSHQQIEKTKTSNTLRTSVTSPNSSTERTSKEKPSRTEALGPVRAPSSAPNRSEQVQRSSRSQREQEKKSTQFAAPTPSSSSENKLGENKPAESKPVESKPMQTAQALPTQHKELNTTSPSPNANASLPAAAPPADLEKEKPLVKPIRPEPILARTPVVSVSFDPYASIRMPKTEKSKKSHQGKSLQMGRLLSRVDPIYPEEAKQRGVEGTVRVHAIFNREGAVQSVISLDGPPLLVPAAMNAVRQWRFSPTILGGQAMETEEDVTVRFSLANSTSKN